MHPLRWPLRNLGSMVGERQPRGVADDLLSPSLPTSPLQASPPVQAALATRLAAIAQGDERALGDLYDSTAGLVYALAERILRDAREAEEVLVEVFHYVWKKAHRYDASRGTVTAWLMVITRGRSLDRARARTARARREEELPPESKLSSCADPAGSAEAELMASERNGALGRALQALSERERHVIELAFFRGRTHEEIARDTGLPLGTIKSQIRRGLERLQQLLRTLETER